MIVDPTVLVKKPDNYRESKGSVGMGCDGYSIIACIFVVWVPVFLFALACVFGYC